MKNHILPRLDDMALAELRRADVKEFVEEILDKNSREMTPKVLVSLKSLLKEAVERDWIPASPAADVKLKRQKRHDKQAKIPTKDEIRFLIEHAPERWRPDCPKGELGLVFPNGKGNAESYGNIMR